jgi:hypothetical protein
MRLVRIAVLTVIACGLQLAAEQRLATDNTSNVPLEMMKVAPKLPNPMSSAIDHIVTGDSVRQHPLMLPGAIAQGLALAQNDRPVKECSIPLTRYKIPGDKEFFIREAPVPTDPTRMDSMPAIQAPVCPEPAGQPAH